jgi:regulator of replication initiation timing
MVFDKGRIKCYNFFSETKWFKIGFMPRVGGGSLFVLNFQNYKIGYMGVINLENKIFEILKEIQGQIGEMKGEIGEMKGQIGEMKGQVDGIKSLQEEDHMILKALEHNVNIIRAEQENLKHEVAELSGEIKAIRKDLGTVELITASNWTDIVKLKAVK